MDPAALAARLETIGGRAAGSDAERRAAALLTAELRDAGGRPRVQTLWFRAGRDLARALLALVGVAASIVAVSHPAVGLGLAAGALAAGALEEAGLAVLGWIAPRRATQNVVAPARGGDGRVLLVLAAAADAPRESLLRAYARHRAPSAPVLLAAALAGVAGCAALRLGGAEGAAIGAAQLVPSLALIGLAGLFADAATARAPARAPAGGAAAALAVAGALRATAPRTLAVEVLIAGAGEAGAAGAAAHVRRRRRERAPEDVVLLELVSGAGPLRYATRAGAPVAVRLHPRLVALAAALPGAAPTALRRRCAASVARGARWPALALEGEPRALAAAALRLIAAIDREIAQARAHERR